MPKTHLDGIAVPILIVAFFFGSSLVRRAGRELTEAQKAVLAARGMDPVAICATLAIGVAYFCAPLVPLWALSAAVACLAVCAYRLVRHHSGQQYSRTRRTYLIAGLAIQGGGFLVAVILRVVGRSYQ